MSSRRPDSPPPPPSSPAPAAADSHDPSWLDTAGLTAHAQLARDDDCDATHAASALPFPSVPVTSRQAAHVLDLLPSESYTAHRLSHATPHHLHITTRRVFVGPIPDGWLKSHRKDWYKRQLGIHYSSRAATFTAQQGTGRARRLTGLSDNDGADDGLRRGHARKRSRTLPARPSADREHAHPRPVTSASMSAAHAAPSFPQPGDVDEDGEVSDDDDDELAGLEQIEEESTPAATPALLSPVATRDRRPGVSRTASEQSTRGPSMSALLRRSSLEHRREQRRMSAGSGVSKARADVDESTVSSVSFITASEGESDDGSETLTIRGADPEPERANEHADARTETGVPPPPDDRSSRPADAPLPGSPLMDGDEQRVSAVRSASAYSGTTPLFAGKQGSTASLLPKLDQPETNSPTADAHTTPYPRPVQPKGQEAQPEESRGDASGQVSPPSPADAASAESTRPRAPAGVTFSVPEDAETREFQLRARLAQLKQRKTYKRIRRHHVHDGEIVKYDNMLCRVEFTASDLPANFDENVALKYETRTMEKWKEFLVVCRESDSDEAPFALQMYKSRVISAVEKAHQKKASKHTIPLDRKTTRVNLFSSLDKTMVCWLPWKKGTLIYVMQAKSGADSMEWYTFLRNVLGKSRTTQLQINVPDLGVNLRLDNPFERLESVRDMAEVAGGNDDAIVRTMMEEQAVAANIVQRSVEMLRKSRQWSDILDEWMGHSRIGLAWKRYDRLEWIYGANEQKMYGTIGMEKSYDLELRPKMHYPTVVKDATTQQTLTEPPPVEGFLIRLTSQKGREQRLGRSFFKRLYFSTHSNYLVFNKPDKADPPPPPHFHERHLDADHVPSAGDISKELPLIYSVNPYPCRGEYIEWLQPDEPLPEHERERLDQEACSERERSLDMLLNCDGMINLCNVVQVRMVPKPASSSLGDGAGAQDSANSREPLTDAARNDDHDGEVTHSDYSCTLELNLKNKLSVRLQAFDTTTAQEWTNRLQALVTYWKHRSAADIALYKSVRQTNLSAMRIDEAGESLIGQFARKWEVTNSYASPELYHMCGIASCRTIAMSGILYRKPKLRAPFERNLVVLAHGHLLMFQDGLRSASGALEAHSHHDRVASLDLKDCYIYSGLATSLDLAGVETTGSTNRPGQFSLPRMYPADGWSSNDEATMTAFVVWHGTKRSWFRSPVQANGAKKTGKGLEDAGKSPAQLKLVRSLGVTGRSVVFLTRSRAERDHWVLSISMEIERLQRESGGDEIRVQTA